MVAGRVRSVRLLRRVIGVFWWVGWAATALFLLVLPVYGWVTGGTGGSPFYDPMVWAEPLGERGSVAVTGWGEARLYGVEAAVEFTRPPLWFMLASLAGWGLVFGLFLFFLYHLRKLAERVEAGEAFDADNTRRLRLLGSALLASELAEALLLWWQSHVVVGRVQSPVLEFGRVYELDPGMIFAALVLFVLAEIFRRGTLLEEDQALTV